MSDEEYTAFRKNCQKRIKEFAQFDPELEDEDDPYRKKKSDVETMLYYGTDSEDSDFEPFASEKE